MVPYMAQIVKGVLVNQIHSRWASGLARGLMSPRTVFKGIKHNFFEFIDACFALVLHILKE